MADKNNSNPEKSTGGTEAWYKDFVDHASDLVQCVDGEGRFIYVNQAWLTTLKLTAEEVENITLFDVIHPDSMEHCMAAFKQVLNGKAFGEVEAVFAAKDGTPVAVEGSVNVKLDENGRFVHTRGIFRDITERKRAEEELLALKKFNERIIQTIQEGIIISDLNGMVTFANTALLKILGYSSEEFIGSHWTYIVPPQYHALVEAADARRLEDKADRYELILKHKKGALLPFQVSGSPYYNHVTGEIDGTMAVLTDITERKQIEGALKASEEQYRTLYENIPIGVYRSTPGPEGRFLMANPGFMQIFGIKTKEELEQLKVADLYHEPAERAPFSERLINESHLRGVERRLKRLDGTPIWGSITAQTVYNEDGKVAWFDCTIEDITERKQAEEALKEREEEYRQLYSMLRIMSDTMPDMLWAKDLDRKYIFANRAICKNLLNAKSTTEPIGKNDLYFANREREAHSEQPDWHTFGELCMDSDSVTLKEMKPMQFAEYGNVKGKFLYLDVHKAPLFNDKNELIGIVGTARDVTDQKKNEEIMRDSEQRAKKQRAAIAELVLDESIIKEEIISALNKITAVTSNAVDVERSSVWTLDESGNELRCLSLFEAAAGTHSSGDILQAKRMPFYFAAIKEESRISAENAWKDPRTSELTENYLKPLDITSMLDAGIIIDGELKGVICLEHVGEPRVWQADEEAFASTAASLAAQLFLAAERKKVLETLRQSEAKYRFLTENITDVVWTVDLSGNLTYMSPTIKKLTGFTSAELMTMPMHEYFVQEDLDAMLAKLADEVAKLPEERAPSAFMEVRHKTKDNRLVPVELHASWIEDEKGNIIGVQGSTRDITERKKAEEALKESEKKYREILSTIEEGYYEVDLAGNFVFFNDSFYKATGYSREELMQVNYKILYKDPQEIFLAYNRVYKTGIAEKAFGWPVITKDGRDIYVEVSITLRLNEFGEPIGFRGIARDVTERKLGEEKLREYEKLQQLLMKLATECINVPLEQVDTTVNKMLKAVGEFTQVDRAYIFKHDNSRRVTSNTHEWYAKGITPEINNLQDLPLERFIDFFETNQKDDILHIPDITRLPANHSMRSLFEAQDIKAIIMLPLFSEEVKIGFVGFDAVKKKRVFTGQEISLLKVLAEITSNVLTRQQAETSIRYMSYHDQLTGLYNRTFLEEEMSRLNTERQLPLTVIMADLNGLKLANDTYGHKKGDEMLKASAAIIRNSCREEDIISRWGGDEFVMLLPQTTSDEASLICKRIKEGCQNSFVEEVPLSIALGMATKDVKAKDLMDTLKEAEDEMYKRKLTESRSAKSAMVTSLLNTLAEKSHETEKHTLGMQTIAQKIGVKLNLPDSELHRLELLITLHDIGKINIPEDILTNEGSLTNDEWKAIMKHPEIGYRIAMATEDFAHVAEDILTHHERWDGGGYPQGLKGKKIPLLARITAIADAYEVMSNGRPYKKAMSENEIIAEFKRCSGTNFDPELVEVFLSTLEGDG